MRGFYFITDPALSRKGLASDVKNALKAGVTVVQYRNKYASTRTLYKEAALLRSMCRKAVFIVNDRVDIALAVKADGLHIGPEDLPLALCRKLMGRNAVIGVSVRSPAQARTAQEEGADYLGVGPVFRTSTKADAASPVGVSTVRAIRKETDLPLAAIGGITLDNAGEVIEAGADCLCAISSVVTKEDVRKEIMKFQRLFI